MRYLVEGQFWLSFWLAFGKAALPDRGYDAVRRLFAAICRAQMPFCVFVLIARFNRGVLEGAS